MTASERHRISHDNVVALVDRRNHAERRIVAERADGRQRVCRVIGDGMGATARQSFVRP